MQGHVGEMVIQCAPHIINQLNQNHDDKVCKMSIGSLRKATFFQLVG